MRRETSIDAYNAIKHSGLLSKLLFEVYECLFKYGPLTQGETWSLYFSGRQRHDVCPRFAELESRGVIQSVGERPCKLTGKMSLTWDVTGNLPSKPDKKKTKMDRKMEEAIRKEREECARIAFRNGNKNIGNLIVGRSNLDLFEGLR